MGWSSLKGACHYSELADCEIQYQAWIQGVKHTLNGLKTRQRLERVPRRRFSDSPFNTVARISQPETKSNVLRAGVNSS